MSKLHVTPRPARRFETRRFRALVRKELLQLVRDPATMLAAFVLPPVLLLLFTYAISLDVRAVRFGVVLESDSAAAQSLAAAFGATRYFDISVERHRREVAEHLVAGQLRGFVVIPQDFDERLDSAGNALVQIITDGSEPNTATMVAAYAEGVVSDWLAGRGSSATAPVTFEPRFWFNPELESRRFLVPGAIAIVMAIVGTLLTAMLVAREWERGNMESLLSTPASVLEILLGKLLPYFGLGLVATAVCTTLAVGLLAVPLRGSWFALLLLSSAFLIPALGQGLLISVVTKNQFVAAQLALLSSFLPAMFLSGFLYEIDSMPVAVRAIARVIAARYLVESLQTLFLTGDVWEEFVPSMLAMLGIGAAFLGMTARSTRKSLDR